MIFGEADFLPGIVVDKYSDVLVVQSLALGIDHFKELIVELIKKVLNDENDFIIEDQSAYTFNIDLDNKSIFRIPSFNDFPSKEEPYINIYKDLDNESIDEEGK